MAEAEVLAIDPGREKVGFAVIDKKGGVLHLNILERAEVGTNLKNLLAEFTPQILVMGDGTGSRQLAEEIRPLLPDELELKFIDEKGSSARAARLYRQREGNIISRSLGRIIDWRPNRPLDDYAALVLAKKYLRNK